MNSTPPTPLTPAQARRLAAVLRSGPASPVSPVADLAPVPTPQQLLRSASNKAVAQRLRATHQLGLAAPAPAVVAVEGTGVGAADTTPASVAAQDLEVLMLAKRLRAAVTAQTVGTPKMEPTVGKEDNRKPSPTAIDEGVLWLAESIKFVLHPDDGTHSALFNCAIRAGERAARMHEDHAFMTDFEHLTVQRCAALDRLKYPSIPGGAIPPADPLEMLGDALTRSGYIDYWKGVLRHLLGVNRLHRTTANDHLQQLFGVEIQNGKGDSRGDAWYEEFLTRDVCLTRKQVKQFLQEPIARQRALEGIYPIMLMRYMQLRKGKTRLLHLDPTDMGKELGQEGAPKAEGATCRDRDYPAHISKPGGKRPVTNRAAELERKRRERVKELAAIEEELASIHSGSHPPRKAQPTRKARARRDTEPDARYESDETEPTEYDEYSRDPVYDSFHVRDGEGEEECDSQEEEYEASEEDSQDLETEELSAVTSTTTKRHSERDSSTGKSSPSSVRTVPLHVRQILADPSQALLSDLRWEFRKNPRLVRYWEHVIALYQDRRVMDTANPLLMLREIRSDRGLLIADISGRLYQVRWPAVLNIKRLNPRQGCSPLANPHKDDTIASAPTELLLDNHMYPRCLASFREFIQQMKDQALQTSRIRFTESGQELQQRVRDYEDMMKDLFVVVFSSGRSTAFHTNPLHVSRWALLLSFHVKQWMYAVTHGNLGLLTERFREAWKPYEHLVAHQLPDLDANGFLLHLELMGYHCRLCGKVGVVASCCDNPKCTHARSISAGTKPAGPSPAVITESDYQARYELWQADKIAKWEAAGSPGSRPRADKGQFTREAHVTSKGKLSSTGPADSIQFYRFQQHLLPFHTWDERSGFEVAHPE